jgi:CRP-like cAMP-binding protein
MTAADVVDRLADHKTIGGAPRSELEWLAAHGSLRHLHAGEVLTPKGKSVDGLFIVLSGRISISVDRGAGPHKITEWRQGDVTGLLPYSRLVSPPADTIAEESTEVFAVARDHLHTMIRECHAVTSVLVHSMVDRARCSMLPIA